MAETDLQIKVIDALRELYTVISAMQQSSTPPQRFLTPWRLFTRSF